MISTTSASIQRTHAALTTVTKQPTTENELQFAQKISEAILEHRKDPTSLGEISTPVIDRCFTLATRDSYDLGPTKKIMAIYIEMLREMENLGAPIDLNILNSLLDQVEKNLISSKTI